jgi:predicted RNA-binding protein with PUA-like domain
MAHWLLKTEPSDYSFDDLVKDKRTAWSGVANAAALKNMRGMKKGDDLLIYHTGDEKSVIATARVIKEAYSSGSDEKAIVVDIEAGKRLAQPVTLAQIKADKRFADWLLVKIGRLSVVPTTQEQFDAILKLGGGLLR